MSIRDEIDKRFPGVITLDPEGFDEAIIGVTLDGKHLIYEEYEIVSVFKKDGMSDSEAWEYYEFNTVRALDYMGDTRPIIVTVQD